MHGCCTLVMHKSRPLGSVAFNGFPLKPGGQIHEHHADSAITVQGVQGRVEFTVGERKVELVPGVLLTVAAGRPHSVVGVDQGAFILTIGGSHSPS